MTKHFLLIAVLAVSSFAASGQTQTKSDTPAPVFSVAGTTAPLAAPEKDELEWKLLRSQANGARAQAEALLSQAREIDRASDDKLFAIMEALRLDRKLYDATYDTKTGKLSFALKAVVDNKKP